MQQGCRRGADGTFRVEKGESGQGLVACDGRTPIQRKDVASVLDQLGVVIERHIKRRAVGTFTLPGLLKIKVVRKPATKARKMISPFTGQEITVDPLQELTPRDYWSR